MESFEILIKGETYKITRNDPDNTFNVFNHTTFHVIKQNDFGIWKKIEHRFGADGLPIDEVGEAIEKHYSVMPTAVHREGAIARGRDAPDR